MNTRIVFLIACIGSTSIFAQSPTWTWKTLPGLPEARFRYNDICFITPEIGWTIHPYDAWDDSTTLGRIYKTTDGGNSWIIQLDSSHNHFRCAGFATPLHGWVFSIGSDEYSDSLGYDTTLMFETTDGGSTWFNPTDNIDGPPPPGLCGMYVVNTEVTYACGRWGGPSYFMKTTNAGKRWTSIPMNKYVASLIDCYFWSPDSGIVVGGTSAEFSEASGVILFTSDGGSSWVERHRTGAQGEICWKISFPSAGVGYVSLQNYRRGAVLKTTDQGKRWSRKLLPSTSYTLQGVGFINDTLGWAGGWAAEGWQTTNGAGAWEQPFIGQNLNRFRFFGDSIGYCAGKSIFKLTVKPQSKVDEEQDVFLSSVNYPNPFETTTTIRFFIANDQHVTLKICNELGVCIQTLIDGRMIAGSHDIAFTPKHGLPATGTYYYQLRCGTSEIRNQMVRLR